MTQHVRLRVGIALIRAGAVSNHRLVKALLEFATKAVDAPLRLFRQFLLRRAIFNHAHVLAHLELKVLEQ